mmetsp:Transcript_18533/g.52769  ORF Transcript_18533/g.52769 Transcript_18533/m.52769 type:complete len:217 (+) Transcript_18533:494-1144(+)
MRRAPAVGLGLARKAAGRRARRRGLRHRVAGPRRAHGEPLPALPPPQLGRAEPHGVAVRAGRGRFTIPRRGWRPRALALVRAFLGQLLAGVGRRAGRAPQVQSGLPGRAGRRGGGLAGRGQAGAQVCRRIATQREPARRRGGPRALAVAARRGAGAPGGPARGRHLARAAARPRPGRVLGLRLLASGRHGGPRTEAAELKKKKKKPESGSLLPRTL